MKIKLKNLLLISALSATGIFAQNAASEVLENSLQAIGERREIARVRSLQAFADCTGPNGNYTTEIYSARNGRLIFKQVRADGGTYLGHANGQVFWTKDEQSGDFTLADTRTAAVWRGHDFQFLAMEITERFHDLTLAGVEIFNEKAAVRLRGKDELSS